MAAAIMVAVVIWLVVTQPVARVVLGGAILVVPATVLLQRWRLWRAASAFRRRHGKGRDLLIVYSASPHWKEYIETNWLARWHDRSVALNRSEPDWKRRPEAALWRRVAGPLEHTPAAIVVPWQGKPHIVRFFAAFRDLRHGRPRALRAKESELEAILRSSAS